MKNVSQNINFTFSHKLNFNTKVFILPWLRHLLFWQWGFREDLMLFHCYSSSDYILWKDIHLSYDLYSHWENLYHFARHMIYILIGRICIILLVIWFIFPLGEFVSFCSPYDLYSYLGNLYHFAHRIIYILIGRICIILLIVSFIFPLGEFVSFCLSHDLYSHWENLYHLARRIIYIPAWGICIILLVILFIFPLREFVSFCSLYDLYSHLGNLYHLLLERFLDARAVHSAVQLFFWGIFAPHL